MFNKKIQEYEFDLLTVIIWRCGVGCSPAWWSRYGKPTCVNEMHPQRVTTKRPSILSKNHFVLFSSPTSGVK